MVINMHKKIEERFTCKGMAAKVFNIGDLVWAKSRGFPHSTARVEKPPENQKKAKKAHHFLYFLKNKNYAWVPDKWIGPHSEKGVKFCPKRKTGRRANNNSVNLSPKKSLICSTKIKKEKETLERSSQISFEKDGKVTKKVLSLKKEKIQKRVSKKRYAADSEVIHQSPVKAESVDNGYSNLIALKGLSFPWNTTRTSRNMGKDREQEEKPAISAQIPSVDNTVDDEMKVEEPQEENNSEVLMENGPGSNHQSDLANPGFKKAFKVTIASTESSSASYVQSCTDPVVITRHLVEPPPCSPPFDIMTVNQKILSKNINATSKKIGFIGLGLIGRGIVKNLLNTGHDVTVWNRSPEKCVPFVSKVGAFQVSTPYDVVMRCDIIFCCVSDPNAVRAVIFEKNGVLEGIKNSTERKGYIELTTIDPTSSQDVAEVITQAGGRYAEAPLIGSRQLVEGGELICLGAGDRDLFRSCESCFTAFCKHSYFLGDLVGMGSRMSLILSMLKGTVTAAVAEALVLVDRCKISEVNFLELVDMYGLCCPLVAEKGKAMLQRSFAADTPLKYQQKDLNLAVGVGNELNQTMPTTTTANEIYKRAKLMRCGDYDASSVYLGIKQNFIV